MTEWRDITVPIQEPTVSTLLTPVSKVIVAKSSGYFLTTLSVSLFAAHGSMDDAKAAAIRDLLPHAREAMVELERAAADVAKDEAALQKVEV